MTKVEQILHPDFLIRLVSVESVDFQSKPSPTDHGLIFTLEISVMVIEPTNKINVLSENIYSLTFRKVNKFETKYEQNVSHSFQFDTDEVNLQKSVESKDHFILRFANELSCLEIEFLTVEKQLLTSREFNDGE